jgi:hypothetical protein
MRFFARFKRKDESAGGAARHPDTKASRTTADVQSTYSADRPIHSRDEDRFNRWPFAQRIADTIARREESSSLVIGIYGPWGDGKTSVLNLMEQALSTHDGIVPIRFNPWYFESQEQLIRGFFATLADALGRALPSRVEEIGSLMERYGAIVSLASVTVGGIVTLSPGTAVQQVGKRLSTVELETLRKRLDQILRETGKCVAVLIDDIDRLDRPEIQAIFKLIKLSAGFEHTAYVLAFDDAVVADALGEKYGAGGQEAGRAFLEKIIQVPLHLPPADQSALRQLTFEGIDAALKSSGIELSEDGVQVFVRHFVDGVEIRLTTPRQAKRYGNAVGFALPLLKGEVHAVDQLLIEAIRVYYPRLYIAIRDNADVFVPAVSDREDKALHERAQDVLTAGMMGLTSHEQKAVTGLLEVLFPRLKSALGKGHYYGNDWDSKWARQQRICSDEYFPRYFHYALPPRDVGDSTVSALIDVADDGDVAKVEDALKAAASAAALPRLTEKIWARQDTLPASAATTLALAIARNGSLLPREKGMFSSVASTFARTGLLIGKLVRRTLDQQTREELARRIIREAEPIPFALQCHRWLQVGKDEGEEERTVSESVEKELGEILAKRIEAAAANGPPLYISWPEDIATVLWVWKTYGTAAAVRAYLTARLTSDAREASRFLASFVGEAWGVESGLSHKADFQRDSYNFIASLLDAEFVFEQLKTVYGATLDATDYRLGSETPFEERVARQFAYIHRNAKAEATTPEPGTGSTPTE